MSLTHSSVFIVHLSLCSPFSLQSHPPFVLTCLISSLFHLGLFLNLSILLCVPLLLFSLSLPNIPLSLSLPLSFQVLRIMAVFLRLAVLTSARAQTAWCDAATEGCTLCPRAFPRTPRSCESHTHTHNLNTKTCTLPFVQTHHMHSNRNGAFFVNSSFPVKCKVTSRHTHTGDTLLQCSTDAAVCPLLLQELTNYLVNPHTRSHTHIPSLMG